MVDRIRGMGEQSSTSVAVRPRAATWRAKTTLCLLLGLAAGCGQKGPLTLPAGAASAASAPAAMSLPGAPYLARQGAELQLDGVSLDALAREFGTPLYVYSQRAMLDAVAAYQRALAGRPHLLCYAMKANPSLAVLQTFAPPAAASTSSRPANWSACWPPAARRQGGVLRRRQDARRDAPALLAGVRCFNVESQGELDLLSRWRWPGPHGAGQPARQPGRRRRHPPLHLHRAEGQQVRHRARPGAGRLPARRGAAGLQVAGIDCHIGSQIVQVEPYLDALDRCSTWWRRSRPRASRSTTSTSAAAWASPTPTSAAGADELVRRLLRRLDARGHGHRELLFEPGRSLVGNAGVLLTEVLYLKPGEAKNFCIVDAAMNDLMRPAMYQAWMAIEALP
jgi:diaminopimelate decarboxylase